MFYLANSYYNTGQNKKALEMYIKRIAIGGWIEEVWYSYYRLGLTYMRLGKKRRLLQIGWRVTIIILNEQKIFMNLLNIIVLQANISFLFYFIKLQKK